MQVSRLVLLVLVFGVSASFKVGLGVGIKFSNGFNIDGSSFGVDFGEGRLIKSCSHFDLTIKSLDTLFEFVKVYIRGSCVQPFSDDKLTTPRTLLNASSKFKIVIQRL